MMMMIDDPLVVLMIFNYCKGKRVRPKGSWEREGGEWIVVAGGECVRRQDLLKGPLLPAKGQERERV